MSEVWNDLRIAVRSLARRPGLALGIALTIGMGIGATTTIYGIVDGVILKPLPYDDAGRLVVVGTTPESAAAVDPETGLQDLGVLASSDLDGLRERARSFELLGALRLGQSITEWGPAMERQIFAADLGADALEILGARPALGRSFLPEEFAPSAGTPAPTASPAIMLTHAYWMERFGGDPAVLGQSLRWSHGLDGPTASSTIVGVLPADFRVPEVFLGVGEDPQVVKPLPESTFAAGAGVRFDLNLQILGRLASGVSVQQARDEVALLAPEIADLVPVMMTNLRTSDESRLGLGVNGLHAQTVGSNAQTLWIFLGAAALLLLLSTMNAATLLLARTLDRRQELGVRAALGAGRGRLALLLVGESVVLAVVGGCLGIVASYGGVAAFLQYAPDSMPRLTDIVVDGRVLTFAASVSLLVGILVGLLPALGPSPEGVWGHLKKGGRSVADSRTVLRTALVAGQIGLAVVLLSSAGLLFGSFLGVRTADPGFEIEGLAVAAAASGSGVVLDFGGGAAIQLQTWDARLADIVAVPGITAVAGASNLPFETPSWVPQILLPADAEDTTRQGIAGYAVTPGYLETLGIPLVRGRGIESRDGPDSERVVLVNEAFVETYMQGEDPIGMVLRRPIVGILGRAGEVVPMTVVGVVSNVVQARVTDGSLPAVYIPHMQADLAQLVSWSLVARFEGSAESVLSAMHERLAASASRAPQVTLMTDRVAATHITPRFQAFLISFFALVAMLLAAIGLYGTLAQSVRRRQKELGVRIALGADRPAVVGLVLRDGMRVSLVGLGVGLIATMAVSRILTTLLYDIEPTNPMTLIGVGTVITLVSAAACLAPAWRATAVDPVSVLNAE